MCPTAGTRWYSMPALEEKAATTPQADVMCPIAGTRWYPMPDDPQLIVPCWSSSNVD